MFYYCAKILSDTHWLSSMHTAITQHPLMNLAESTNNPQSQLSPQTPKFPIIPCFSALDQWNITEHYRDEHLGWTVYKIDFFQKVSHTGNAKTQPRPVGLSCEVLKHFSNPPWHLTHTYEIQGQNFHHLIVLVNLLSDYPKQLLYFTTPVDNRIWKLTRLS